MREALTIACASVLGMNLGCFVQDYGELLIEGPAQARIATTLGEFVVALDSQAAPITVANFRRYAEEGFYDGTLVHRVAPGFVAQGGGYLPGLQEKTPTHDPIVLESYNGLTNVRGSVAMARTQEPNSAQAQFFVNLADNAFLDPTLNQPGYAVFGSVTFGLEVVDAIGAVPTQSVDALQDVPVEEVLILSVVIEIGPSEIGPAWAAYFDLVQYNLLNLLRSTGISAFQQYLAQ